MRLSDLVGEMSNGADVEITGLAAHSAEIEPGFLFAALKGSSDDGARYIADAKDRGAVAVLAGKGVAKADGVIWIAEGDPRRALARMAASFYGRQPETVVAVTGTNGKTSVAWFVRLLWEALGLPAAQIGTLGVVGEGLREALHHTTPQPVELHRVLADLAGRGIGHVALEASSHGLDQRRLDGTRLAAAAFTNLSRDHLDYHTDAKSYLDAKMRLFTEVMAPGGVAVLNADSPEYPAVAAACRDRGHQVLSFGRHGAQLCIVGHRPNGGGHYVELASGGAPETVRISLVGDFQVWNALCALGLVIGAGGGAAEATAALANLHGVPGRVQEVAEVHGGRVFVDYAHTPDALEHCLGALRLHARNHLTVVFGCGGDRDRGKRPQMGRIACELADRIVVTDDNPRTEDPVRIRADVMAGCVRAVEVPGRAEAIRTAIAGLDTGDILVIAGKGHETGQIVGETEVPFDDAEQARLAASEFARVSV